MKTPPPTTPNQIRQPLTSPSSSPKTSASLDWVVRGLNEDDLTTSTPTGVLENLSKLAFPEVFDLVWGNEYDLSNAPELRTSPLTPPLTNSLTEVRDPGLVQDHFSLAIAAAAATSPATSTHGEGTPLTFGDDDVGLELSKLWYLEDHQSDDPYTPTKRPRSRRSDPTMFHESPMKSRRTTPTKPEQQSAENTSSYLLSLEATTSPTVFSTTNTTTTHRTSKKQNYNKTNKKKGAASKSSRNSLPGDQRTEGAVYESNRRRIRRGHLNEIKTLLHLKRGTTANLVYRALHKAIGTSKTINANGSITLNSQQMSVVTASARKSKCSDGKRALRERMLRMESSLLLSEVGRYIRAAGGKLQKNPPGNDVLKAAVQQLRQNPKLLL